MPRTALAVILVAVFASHPAFAQQGAAPQAKPQDDSQKFDQTKARLLKNLDQRIDRLQKLRSCVNDAKDSDALRACRPPRQKGGK